LALSLALRAPADAAPLSGFAHGVGAGALASLAWWVVTIGTALAALTAFALLLRARSDEGSASAEKRLAAMNVALDRTRALLDADDQRTIVWEAFGAEPEIFGGLPEAAGAPADKTGFLLFRNWLSTEGAIEIETAIDRLRRNGEAFQLALRTAGDALLEVTGRSSGRRSVVRFRELTGERRSFAELREQASFVISEVTALRALADMLPTPLWRRNRVGRLTWVNAAYVRAVDAATPDAVLSAGIELLPSRTRDAIREAHRAGADYRDSGVAVLAGARRTLAIHDCLIEDGSVGAAVDVSEVEIVRENLRRLAESNARILDQLAAGVVVFGKDGHMAFHNAAFRAIWGLSEEALAAQPDEGMLLDQLRSERKLPEQSNYRDWREKHLAAYRDDTPREEVWHLPDRRTLRIVALPNADGGMTYIYENVTQEIMLRSRLTALSQLQGETLDHVSEAVAVFGTDGRLRLFNPVFAEIWRLSPASLRNEPHIGEIIANCRVIYSDRQAWDAIRTAVTDLDHDEQATGRMQRPDGSVIDYATVALPEGMTMLTFADVTDSTRIERFLKERNEALEAADRLKSDFIQHVSYELRSPLQTIIGFSELLSDAAMGSLTRQQREYMDHIESSSRALLALINDILDLATVDAGIMTLDVAETDIAEMVISSIEGLRDRLEEQRMQLEIVVPEDIGVFHVDAQRVRQILFNLVSNAIRFSNAGGHIRLSAKRDKDVVVFTVKDDGIGIPKESLPEIFSPFETHATQGKRGGAGLGLSIVRSLVELHGGTVEIQSEEGKGTTAIVRLPVVPASVAEAAE
jgi:signal transduction histidine kinase